MGENLLSVTKGGFNLEKKYCILRFILENWNYTWGEKNNTSTGELENNTDKYYFLVFSFFFSEFNFFIYYFFHAAFWKEFGKHMKAICRILCSHMP